MPSSKNKAARSALDTLFDARTAPVGAQYSKRSKITKQEDHLGLIGPTTSNLAHAIDVFSNPAARTGYGTSSLENYAEYPLMRFSLNFWAIISFFESSWIARRIVCAPAEDIVKTWPKITSDIDPEDLTRIDRAVRRTNTRSKVREAIEKARLFGGAGALIAIKKQDKELDQPLELDSVGIHDYAGLITFDRWSGISPTGDVCDDLNRPLDFGHSEFYEVKVKGGDSFKVHNSRILRFSGPRMPEPENSAYQDWGISVLAPVIQTIQGYDTLTSNALSLSFRANILGMKAPDLAGMMSGLSMNQAAAQKFEQRMQRFNEMLSNQSLALLEKDGELSQTQYSFAGLSDMMQMWQLAISGAAKMPVTRLWGRTYSGLGQAGDGDEKIYEETISTESDVTLRPALEKLYPVLCMSELGEVPDDLDLLFPSIRVLDDKEKAELAKTVVDTAVVALNAGGISLRTFAKELKQSSTRTEIFTNITDEDIEKLSDKVQAEGEMGEGLFGAEGGGLNPASSPAKALTEENKAGKVNGQPGEADEPQGHQAPPNGSVEEGSEGTSKAKDAGSKYATTRAELVWLDACDNEALTLPKALRGTEQGEIELHKRVVRNLSFYAEQAHVDPAKCMAYARSRGFAQDADLRKGVTKCQWCAADLDGDDVNGSVVCPSCSDAYRRGRANDVKPWSAAKLATVEALRSAGFRITSDSNYAYIVWFGTEAPGARKPDLDLRATVSGNGQYEMGVWVRGAYVTTERGFKPEHVQQQVLKYVQRARANDADGPAVETKTIHGLPVVIEQKRGQWRTGQGWRVKMAYDYGYFQNIPGADGDSLDICIGPDPSSTWIYIFDQKHLPPRRGFDEHKCFVGYSSMDDAIKAFNAGHDRACQVYLDITPMQLEEFKTWLRKGDHTKPVGGAKA
jgi:phage-related protein (TIGR01555 family)